MGSAQLLNVHDFCVVDSSTTLGDGRRKTQPITATEFQCARNRTGADSSESEAIETICMALCRCLNGGTDNPLA